MGKPIGHFSTYASGEWIQTYQAGAIAPVWDEVGPVLSRAMERQSAYTLGDVRQLLESANAQLWVARTDGALLGVAVTKVFDFPQERVVEVSLAAGDEFERWGRFLKDIEEWAAAIGAKRVRIMGRKGWVRMLKDYKETRVILEKAL